MYVYTVKIVLCKKEIFQHYVKKVTIRPLKITGFHIDNKKGNLLGSFLITNDHSVYMYKILT